MSDERPTFREAFREEARKTVDSDLFRESIKAVVVVIASVASAIALGALAVAVVPLGRIGKVAVFIAVVGVTAFAFVFVAADVMAAYSESRWDE